MHKKCCKENWLVFNILHSCSHFASSSGIVLQCCSALELKTAVASEDWRLRRSMMVMVSSESAGEVTSVTTTPRAAAGSSKLWKLSSISCQHFPGVSAAPLPGHKVTSRTTKVSLLSDSGSSDLGRGMSGPWGGGRLGTLQRISAPPPEWRGGGQGRVIYASKVFPSQQSMNFIPWSRVLMRAVTNCNAVWRDGGTVTQRCAVHTINTGTNTAVDCRLYSVDCIV